MPTNALRPPQRDAQCHMRLRTQTRALIGVIGYTRARILLKPADDQLVVVDVRELSFIEAFLVAHDWSFSMRASPLSSTSRAHRARKPQS
jgi:hypothetical protein